MTSLSKPRDGRLAAAAAVAHRAILATKQQASRTRAKRIAFGKRDVKVLKLKEQMVSNGKARGKAARDPNQAKAARVAKVRRGAKVAGRERAVKDLDYRDR